jgi:hypothetical protein
VQVLQQGGSQAEAEEAAETVAEEEAAEEQVEGVGLRHHRKQLLRL